MSAICELCFHHCNLDEGQTSLCRARTCRDGAVIPLNYGKLTSLALDPIEKKPLRRFRPGSLILSVGSFGCNLRCPFCQNHEISMAGETDMQTVELSPEQLTSKAAELRTRGNIGVAYTYNEPLVSYEYVRDCASLVHAQGMVNVLVTNGTIEETPLADAPALDRCRQHRPERIYPCVVPAARRGPGDGQALHHLGGGAVPCGGDHPAGPRRKRQCGRDS